MGVAYTPHLPVVPAPHSDGNKTSIRRRTNAGYTSTPDGPVLPNVAQWSVTGSSDRSLLGWVLVTCIVRLLG